VSASNICGYCKGEITKGEPVRYFGWFHAHTEEGCRHVYQSRIESLTAENAALKAEVERLNRLVPCRYCLEQYDPIEMHEMDYDDGPETKQFLICDDCYENHHSAEPPEQVK